MTLRPFLLFLFLLGHLSLLRAQENLFIHCNQPADTGIRFMQGFLHGNPAALDSEMVAQLRPEFWRLGAYFLAGSSYEDAARFNPEITINLNDLYMIVNNIPSQTQSQPWQNNWQSWDSLIAAMVSNAVATGSTVDYWDLWGEPDNFWTGSYAQWIEMYRRSDSIIHSIDPAARIVGPEFGFGSCNFSVIPVLNFLDSLHAAGSEVNAVSWHEFCAPEDVPAHVQQVRDSLAVRPWAAGLPILIPEYAGPANSTIPGWNAGWLYYLEKANVDWASHACWNESNGTTSWSNCEHGLNGLFMNDNATPQPNYWVHRAYAEIGNTRVITSSTHTRTVALAGIDSVQQSFHIIAGRYDNPNLGSHNAPANVTVRIRQYPFGSNTTVPLVVQRIPSNNVNYSVPLAAPQTMYTGTLTFTADSADVLLPGFVDGDVYVLYINPAPGSLLDTPALQSSTSALQLVPNPAQHEVMLHWPGAGSGVVTLYTLQGKMRKQITTTGASVMLPLADLPAGVYVVEWMRGTVRQTSRLVITE